MKENEIKELQRKRKEKQETEAREMSEKICRGIFSLLIGQSLNIDNAYNVVRVPSGWTYVYSNPTGGIAAVFVPWSDEGMPEDLRVAAEMGGLDQSVIVAPEGLD